MVGGCAILHVMSFDFLFRKMFDCVILGGSLIESINQHLDQNNSDIVLKFSLVYLWQESNEIIQVKISNWCFDEDSKSHKELILCTPISSVKTMGPNLTMNASHKSIQAYIFVHCGDAETASSSLLLNAKNQIF